MAWVTSLKETRAKGRIQPTHVQAIVKVFDTEDSRSIVQIDTRGSSNREMPDKQSQTLQFGEEAARQLFDVLKRTFKFE
jgi:hypothetical protein